jgi:lipoprotein-anchoring transpeptidase ErfK/SrfK
MFSNRTARTALLAAVAIAGCRRTAPTEKRKDARADGGSVQPRPSALPAGPTLGAIDGQVNVYSRPDENSKRLGYLRLGTIVARDPDPVTKEGCPDGWYKIHPQGFVCVGKEATLDSNHPILRAATTRPDLTKPLPYAYAFVRAVAPQYLKIPTEKEQLASEFKLKEHLEWWNENREEVDRVELGANDVPIDARGVPLPKGAPPSGKLSTQMSLGELFGGRGPDDPIPFWLEGGQRAIPNLSDYHVPPYAIFANRVRRHTGLALVGSFPTGPESLNRRFAVTVDMRLVPTTKLKPDTGSAFHGVELTGDLELPLAFVTTTCQKGKDGSCAHSWKLGDDKAHEQPKTLAWRSLVPLSGKSRRVGPSLFRETKDGTWLKASDLGVASAPDEWPAAAQAGQKWVDISITNETMILWEGKKPIYVTLVSAGQDGLGDPKTTKSTVLGVFRIRSKHVTATMDSNERSSEGEPSEADDADRPAAKPAASAKPAGSAEPGQKRRRGEGTFQLRDVPYVEYFEKGYALHAAYWHDVFGRPRSHGCVNLSPVDAHRLFLWTEPNVPQGWHGVFTAPDWAQGTTVVIHK